MGAWFIGGYFALTLLFGLLHRKKAASGSVEFFLAGRSVAPVLIGGFPVWVSYYILLGIVLSGVFALFFKYYPGMRKGPGTGDSPV